MRRRTMLFCLLFNIKLTQCILFLPNGAGISYLSVFIHIDVWGFGVLGKNI